MRNRMADYAELFRIFAERGLNEKEINLFTEILRNEYDYGWRAAEYHHNIPTQREYATGHAESVSKGKKK